MAESFVETFKTELIKDRVWRTNSQLELAILEYVAWFNTRRIHTAIGNRPPLEHEAECLLNARYDRSAVVSDVR
jgi:putative transposase